MVPLPLHGLMGSHLLHRLADQSLQHLHQSIRSPRLAGVLQFRKARATVVEARLLHHQLQVVLLRLLLLQLVALRHRLLLV